MGQFPKTTSKREKKLNYDQLVLPTCLSGVIPPDKITSSSLISSFLSVIISYPTHPTHSFLISPNPFFNLFSNQKKGEYMTIMPSTLHLETYPTATTTSTTDTAASDLVPVPKTMAAEMKPSLAEALARELSLCCPSPDREMDTVARFHNHEVGRDQCCSVVVQRIAAPVDTVWGLVRRFDQPQTYKHFLRSCRVITGDGAQLGCLREVHVVSGLPATSSTERLEVLDEESHAIGFRVVSGEHRLQNYRSVTTLHPSSSCYYNKHNDEQSGEHNNHNNNNNKENIDEQGGTVQYGPTHSGTVVVESYVVDVPHGNTKQETCVFVDTIVRCNLQTLARIAERMVASSSSTTTTTSPSSSSSCKVS